MSKVWSFIKKNWKILLGIAAVLFGIKYIPKLIASIVGEVKQPTTFTKVPGDKKSILVKDGTDWVKHGLPDGITSDKVQAAGLTPEGKVEVTIAHETIDRKSAIGDSDSSLNIR